MGAREYVVHCPICSWSVHTNQSFSSSRDLELKYRMCPICGGEHLIIDSHEAPKRVDRPGPIRLVKGFFAVGFVVVVAVVSWHFTAAKGGASGSDTTAAEAAAAVAAEKLPLTDILFHDVRRADFSWWAHRRSKHRTCREAIEALAALFGEDIEWVEAGRGDTEVLVEIHRNLIEAKLPQVPPDTRRAYATAMLGEMGYKEEEIRRVLGAIETSGKLPASPGNAAVHPPRAGEGELP